MKTLKTKLLSANAFPTWAISLPSDSSCGLTATTNILGRFLNGVALGSVCGTGSTASTATGHFVHVEQDTAARASTVYAKWENALKATFGL